MCLPALRGSATLRLDFRWWPALTVRLQQERRAILRYACYLLPLSLLLTLFVSFLGDWRVLVADSSAQRGTDRSWLMLTRAAGPGIGSKPLEVFEGLKQRHADQLRASSFAFREAAFVHPAGAEPFKMDLITADELWFQILGLQIGEGRGFNARDRLTRQSACLLSLDASQYWFADTQAVGQALQVNGRWCRVEGVLALYKPDVAREFGARFKNVVFLPRSPQRQISWSNDLSFLFAVDVAELRAFKKQLIISVNTQWPDLGGWYFHAPVEERIAQRDRLAQWLWMVGGLCIVVAVPTLWALFWYFRGLEYRHRLQTTLRLQLGATLFELRCLRIPIAIVISGLSSAGVVLCLGWLSLLDALWAGLWWRPDLNIIRLVVLAVLVTTLLTAAMSVLGLTRQESDYWPESD